MRRAYLVATCQSCHGQFGPNGSEPPNQDGAGMLVLILGRGFIGTSTTYHRTARRADVVLERSAVACAASGRSGGFLVLDWCDGTPLMALARRSFALHAELVETLGLEIPCVRLILPTPAGQRLFFAIGA
jgi:hypothetical protein